MIGVSTMDDLRAMPGIYQVRRSRYRKKFLYEGQGTFFGRFNTYHDALGYLPEKLRSTYDNNDLVEINIDMFSQVQIFDWPVMFYLQDRANKGRLSAVTDFGGHVGVKYYAYSPFLQFSESFLWQAVEVPAMVEAGKKRPGEGNRSLRFYERIEDTAPCDVLLCSGVLQYSPLTIEEIIGRMPKRPAMVILSRVSTLEAEGLYTLENFNDVKIPHRIFSLNELEQSRQTIGYSKLAHWHIPHRDFEIPFEPGTPQVKMIGEVWVDASLH